MVNMMYKPMEFISIPTIILCHLDTIGFTIGFSQLLSTFSEGDGSVRVCAELTSGEIPVELGVVSLSVTANLANSSGNRHSIVLLTHNIIANETQ